MTDIHWIIAVLVAGLAWIVFRDVRWMPHQRKLSEIQKAYDTDREVIQSNYRNAKQEADYYLQDNSRLLTRVKLLEDKLAATQEGQEHD